MPLDLEQQVRLLRWRQCQMMQQGTGNNSGGNTGGVTGTSEKIESIKITPEANSTSLFSEFLVGVSIVYVDREGMPLQIILPTEDTIIGTRQCKQREGTGYIDIDPNTPASGTETFQVIIVK